MTDTQILTLVVAAIIINVAVLSLVAIPLLRRRLAPRADVPQRPTESAKSAADQLATVSADRLASVIGASPSLSAPVPSSAMIASDLDELPVETLEAETDENGVPGTGTGTTDAIDAVRAAQAPSEAGPSTAATTGSHAAQDEATDADMDYMDLSAARARGYAIHPEDPLVAATIDRLLGARRDASAHTPALDAIAAFGVPPGTEPERATPSGAPGTPTAEDAGAGRPVMGPSALSDEAYVEPTIDPETGLDSPLAWSTAITIEEARSSRYGRPVSVVIAELDGLDRLTELLGPDVADRLIPPVADALRRNARAADRVARLSHTRFGVLLVETDEVRAINYVERVRSACDSWLEASAIALRLSIGWASPATDGDLRSTVRVAEDRMFREQHRPAAWRPAANTAPPATSQTEG